MVIYICLIFSTDCLAGVYSGFIRKHLEIMAAFQTTVGAEMVEIVVARDELIDDLAKKDVDSLAAPSETTNN